MKKRVGSNKTQYEREFRERKGGREQRVSAFGGTEQVRQPVQCRAGIQRPGKSPPVVAATMLRSRPALLATTYILEFN